MQVSRTVGAAILALSLGAVAQASTVCDTYHDLNRFGLIGRTLFKAGIIPAYGCAQGSSYDKAVCTTKAKIAGLRLESFDPPANLVATQSVGAAVIFQYPEAKNPCDNTWIDANVITGGGQVLSKGTYPPDIGGVTDVTGVDPQVSSCSGAMLDMVAASNAIHAAPAVLTLDELKVPADGNTVQLTVPAGGGIVRIGRLTLGGVRSQIAYGYNYECLYSSNYYQAAWLEILGGQDDDVVLDVGELSIGNCAFITQPSEKFLINVAGKGRKVKIGTDSRGDYAINLLAPERVVKVSGEKASELGTYVGFIWADKLLMSGYTWPVSLDCDGSD
jgi:hypothetical protein